MNPLNRIFQVVKETVMHLNYDIRGKNILGGTYLVLLSVYLSGIIAIGSQILISISTLLSLAASLLFLGLYLATQIVSLVITKLHHRARDNLYIRSCVGAGLTALFVLMFTIFLSSIAEVRTERFYFYAIMLRLSSAHIYVLALLFNWVFTALNH